MFVFVVTVTNIWSDFGVASKTRSILVDMNERIDVLGIDEDGTQGLHLSWMLSGVSDYGDAPKYEY